MDPMPRGVQRRFQHMQAVVKSSERVPLPERTRASFSKASAVFVGPPIGVAAYFGLKAAKTICRACTSSIPRESSASGIVRHAFRICE